MISLNDGFAFVLLMPALTVILVIAFYFLAGILGFVRALFKRVFNG